MSYTSSDVRAKVLIAEHDTIVALDLQGMVSRLGYDVVTVVDNSSAALLSVRRFVPDIVLMDISLPGEFDGIETAREIHKVMDVPIVFCVASPELSVLSRAKQVAYAGYLLKPISPDSLATTIDTVLYKYKLEKRVRDAEEMYRLLVNKCEIMTFFMEQNAAIEWKWTETHGLVIKGADFLQVDQQPDLSERLISLSSTGENGRIAALLLATIFGKTKTPLAAIGVRDMINGLAHGILVPLDSSD